MGTPERDLLLCRQCGTPYKKIVCELQGLQDGSSEVIYIPTEANLPILEARNR